jgi:death-on-curing protein
VSWRWLSKRGVLAMHGEQLAEHGGSPGLRDEGLLESALARPQNIAAYGDPSVFDLAAAYAFGIARNHPFIDGNKRTSLLAAYSFLRLNGRHLRAPEPDAVTAILRLAAGELAEAELASWLAENSD